MIKTALHYRFLNIPSGDIRISITDKCNMDCAYCHNEGQEKGDTFLSKEVIDEIVENSLRYGVYKVRLTGGEPTLHSDFIEICKSLKAKSKVKLLGVNTNGFNSNKIFEAVDSNSIDQLVIGLDFFKGPVSKLANIGPSPQQVMDMALVIKKSSSVNVEIDVVYTENDTDILLLCDWCISNRIVIKVLEMASENEFEQTAFERLFEKLKKRYGFEVGKDVHYNEYYLYDVRTNAKKIVFYHSHCNRRDCEPCKYMHLRVTAHGNAKPCMLRIDTEHSLLSDFDVAMSKAIANLGVPPEMEAR